MSKLYSQETELCFADRIGASGLPRAEWEARRARLDPAIATLRAQRDDGALPLLGLPARREDLGAVRETAARYRESFADVLVLGTGGSSLGGATLTALARDPDAPRLHFLDNVDPDGFEAVLAGLDLARTGALVISKSGTTAETVAQTLALVPRLAGAAGEGALSRHVTVITEPPKGGGATTPIRRLAENLSLPVLDHDPGIGGRYAALTNVGLLPAAIAGLDPEAARAGAAEVAAATLDGAGAGSAPAEGAALAVTAAEGGLSATVLMPYLDRLRPFALWYRQLWAESLGKGGHGTTPIAAHGTVDQHSQLQLWLDGPADKLYTLVLGDPAGTGDRLDPVPAGAGGLEYLAGRTMGDLLAAEQEATAETLARNGRPVRVFRIGRPDAATAGALMMHFMLETVIAAALIGVDPFDQPAVEEGKVLARARLEAMGGTAGEAAS